MNKELSRRNRKVHILYGGRILPTRRVRTTLTECLDYPHGCFGLPSRIVWVPYMEWAGAWRETPRYLTTKLLGVYPRDP